MRFYLPQSTVSPLTVIRRERVLPGPGEIEVQEGDRVDPTQIVGRALVPGGFSVVDITETLDIPLRMFKRALKVKIGQEVKEGQVLAVRPGLARRSCRSPMAGQVVSSGGGKLLIEAPRQAVEVRANYYGTIARVMPEHSASIEIAGALIQGTWGNNQQDFGVLRVMVKNREGTLKERSIDPSSRGVILVGGATLDPQALERAVELQSRGIIVGGIPSDLLEEARKMPFPIVATEGIGIIPMSGAIFQLLSTHDGREAILDARFSTGQRIVRPEIIIPLPAEANASEGRPEEEPLKVNDRVRAVRPPHVGMTGKVVDIPPAAVRIATGARLPVAKVEPESKGAAPVLIPVTNLEILR